VADFDAIIVGGEQTPWIDAPSASPEAPSRLNPDPAYLPSYRVIELVDINGAFSTVLIKAVVGGVVAPMDAALDGRLFSWAWAEWSGDAPPPVVLGASQSSLATITLYRSANHYGHFLFRFRRAQGGVVLVPFDVVQVQGEV
jgi:hypothetical protein